MSKHHATRSPAVTVVVPLYNKAATIERSIRSVLAQTFADFELIVVDDGSTDGSPELVERAFSDPRLTVHRQANAGPAAARNQGIRLSSAPLITFLDADDEWTPALLETAVAKLAEHPDCAAFTANYYCEPAHTARWSGLGYRDGPYRLTPRTPRNELRHATHAFHACTAVYRKDYIRAMRGFYEASMFGEDVYLWIKLLLNYPIYRHMTPLGHYHMDSSELGIGARRGILPVQPHLTDPSGIWERCPEEMGGQFAKWLGDEAYTAVCMHLGRGNPQTAFEIMDSTPHVRASETLVVMLRLAIGERWWNRLRGRGLAAA
jgi:glycosyltransferase involved in cell wall biosynthesis